MLPISAWLKKRIPYCCPGCVTCVLLVFLCIPAHGQDIGQLTKQQPFAITGGIDARAIFYKASGISPRYLPFNYYLSGTPVISLYGIQIPLYFSFSRQQNSFSQPFNQFGLSPEYKWVKVHAGYRNLHYSNFTLAGHTFLGGGLELRPGKWRIDGMYGRFNKATVLDTLQGVYVENFSFQRTGYTVKLGYGTERSYFDLITLRAKDHANSAEPHERASLDSMSITPGENWVNGFQGRLTIFDGKVILESDGAISLYTHDSRLNAIPDSVLNDDIKRFENFVPVNSSSQLYGAFQASASYKIRSLTLKLQYRFVDAGYKSMGAYFLNNDLENWTINPAVTLAQGKVRFYGSVGFQRDNLQNTKRATARRIIGAANVTAQLNENLGVDVSYTNFSNTQRARTIRFADSLRVAQSTQNLSISPRYIKISPLHTQSVIVSLNWNIFKDLNENHTLEDLGNDIITQTYFITYNLGFTASRSSVFVTLNHTRLSNEVIQDRNTGLTLGGSKSFSHNKIVLTASSSYLQSRRNGDPGFILNESIQARFNAHDRHSFPVMVSFLGNYPKNESAIQRKYTEVRAEIGYNFNF